MVRRKIWMFLAVLVMSMFFIPKEVYAGTCTYTVGSGRMASLNQNNCDPATEYPYVYNYGCECKPKATSGSSVNTCACTGSGTITKNNCQGSTPNAICELRSATCKCSQYTTLEDATKNGYQNNVAANTSNSYDYICTPDSGGMGTSTALGCVPVDVKSFVPWLLQYLFGIAGGIAFLLMAYGFILIATSGGDEKKVAGAKETITSAIIGLFVCIFAIFILKLIAVNILNIPGF